MSISVCILQVITDICMLHGHISVLCRLDFACGMCDSTSGGLLVVLLSAPPLHLYHTPLDATVVDVAELLGVLFHAFQHWVGGGGSEAALALLKVLVVSHLVNMAEVDG